MDALSLIGIKQLPACISYSNPSLEEDRKSWSCFNFADHTRLCNPTTRGPGHYARVYEKSQTYSGEERAADAARDPAVLCQCGKRGKHHYIHGLIRHHSFSIHSFYLLSTWFKFHRTGSWTRCVISMIPLLWRRPSSSAICAAKWNGWRGR